MTAAHPRYFYTDPLATAWMSEQFGFQYVNDLPHGQQHAFRVVGVTQGWSSQNPFEMRLDFRGERRFYIHPDSLHLLEPQDGDVLRWSHDGFVHVGLNAVEPKTIAGVGIFPMRRVDAVHGGVFTMSVIQRNGMAFHWPESEAA